MMLGYIAYSAFINDSCDIIKYIS